MGNGASGFGTGPGAGTVNGAILNFSVQVLQILVFELKKSNVTLKHIRFYNCS